METLGELASYLQSADLNERLYAKQSLAKLDTKVLANSISSIVALLEEEDALSKRCALALFEGLPMHLVTALLARILPHLEDDDADVRRGVVAVLRQVPSEALDEHAELILAFASHEAWPVRVTGLRAFACLSHALIEAHLDDILTISLADVDSSGVRWTALDVLQTLVGGCWGAGESSLDAVLLQQASKVVDLFLDADKTVRWKAASVFGSYPAAVLVEAVDVFNSLVECLEHSLPGARATTLLALARLKEPQKGKGEDAAGPVLRLLRPHLVHGVVTCVRDEDMAVRWAALHAIQSLPVEALLAADAEERHGQGKGWLVAEVVSRARGDEAGNRDGDGEGEMDRYVQRAAAQLLESLHEASAGALVEEEMAAEARQIRQRLEAEEAAAALHEWDEEGGKWRHD